MSIDNMVTSYLLLILLPVCWAGLMQDTGGGDRGGKGRGGRVYDGNPQDNDPNGPWVNVRSFVVPRYVALGKNATLECDYEVREFASLYSLKWYKGNSQFYQFIPNLPQRHSIFSVEGINKDQVVPGPEGRKVAIIGIESSASDSYRCEMVAEGPPFHTTQRSGNMTVAVVPDERPILAGSREYYHLHDLVLLNCTAPYAKPSINLTWYINERQADNSSVTIIEHKTNPAELVSYSSQLSLRVTHHHFRNSIMSIKCVGRLSNLYFKWSHVTIREPSSRWFISSNLYHTSDCQQTKTSKWLLRMVLVLVSLHQLYL